MTNTAMTLEELEQLFPTGDHHGAVKTAGLRVLNVDLRRRKEKSAWQQ